MTFSFLRGSLAAVISNTVSSFGNTTNHVGKVAGDEPTWLKINKEIYGAKADERGPISGGNGYKNVITKGDYTVTDVDGLLEALTKVKWGEIIFIPSETLIDLTTRIYIDELVLAVPEGVTLAGDRGYKGSKGALLSSDSPKTPLMIRVGGPNVRITGLRIQGPNPKLYLEHHRRSFSRTGGLGSEYYYKFPVARGITTAYPHLEVDNCELSAFSGSGISLSKGDGHHIHHNFIHHNQYAGLGYGISHGAASSLIEYNLFDSNRHSIAGSGVRGCGYIARHNIDLFNPHPAEHCFDMHGGKDR